MNTPTYNPAGSPRVIDTTPRPAKDNQFDRFENLTRKLVQVPKTEIDAKRKES